MSRGTWESDPGSLIYFVYRTVTFYGATFQTLQLNIRFFTSRQSRNSIQSNPTTPVIQRFRAWHITGLGYFPFARRYLGNHYCFLFLRLLRCFSSPRLPHRPMYSVYDVTVLTVTGFPIQKSPDQSLFSSSPKLIAAFHVFHRLLTPRHPPFALSSLATKLYCHNNKNNAWNALMLFCITNCQRT